MIRLLQDTRWINVYPRQHKSNEYEIRPLSAGPGEGTAPAGARSKHERSMKAGQEIDDIQQVWNAFPEHKLPSYHQPLSLS